MTYLPFQPHFHDLIRTGRKSMTSRTKKYGEEGEIVDSPVGRLELVTVQRLKLKDIRDHYYRHEGCRSKDEFEQVWTSIHPRKGFDPEQFVWLHGFQPVKP